MIFVLKSFVCLLGVALVLAGCASSPDRMRRFDSSGPVQQGEQNPRSLIARSDDHQKVGNPYVVGGRTYVPRRDDNYDEVGIGSWYGPTFHGRPTANGEIFDQNEMTAAHTTLPIPSIAEVTNLENGRTVIVRINDRGPFVDDRIIDLSRAAAEALDYRSRGLARVRVRYLGPARPADEAPARVYSVSENLAAEPEPARAPTRENPRSSDGPVTLQVGAFSERRNAQILADRLNGAGDVWVEEGRANGSTVYRVYFGRWASEPAAQEARLRLADWGVYDAHPVALN